MKVFAVRPHENWIIDRVVQEWKATSPDISTDNLAQADLIWLASGWTWEQVPLEALQAKKVVVSVHHIVQRKFDRQALMRFLMRDQYVDEYHVPCQKTKDFISRITKKPITVLGYWYNSKIWRPLNKSECRKQLGLPADDYIVGSFQRDTESFDLASPKLEKGPDLLVEYLRRVNRDNLSVLLGGFRRQYVISRLKELDIKYSFIEMAPFDILNKMYSSCDLYIVSSRCEGGPQAILEAAVTETPIVSTDVGMASAVLSENCVIDIPNEIYTPTVKDIEFNYQNVQKFELHTQVPKYNNMFRDVLERR
jgi:glycosyltransferase involved in cell wall biosynthesis